MELRESKRRTTTTTATTAFLLLLPLFLLSFSPFQTTQPPPKNNSEASPPDLEALATDLPADHPFAVVEEVTPEEAELAVARLRVRRGLPLRDLSGARGFSSPSDEEEKR